MTKRQIYDTIVALTDEIKATDIGMKLFEAAKSEGMGRKVKEVSETFKSEYPELYQNMCSFATEINKLMEESETSTEAGIFGPEKDEENQIFVLDPNVINASSYFALTFLTDIDDTYLFTGECIEVGDDEYVTDDSAYLDAIEEESGSSDLANFLGTAFFSEEELKYLEDYGFKYSNIYDLLADVFAGKLKEYVE